MYAEFIGLMDSLVLSRWLILGWYLGGDSGETLPIEA